MAITLAEAKVGMANKVDQKVIETIQRNSRLLDLLIFDDALAPGTGGSTFVYGYTQLLTPASASGRKINQPYTAQEAKRTIKTTTLTIMGGSYEIDRALFRTENRKIQEVAFQNEQKAKATASRYQYLAINGVYNENSDDPEFDGLSKLLAGTENEIDCKSISLATVDESKALAFDEALRNALYSIAGGKPTAILANSRLITKMTTVAHKLGFYDRTIDAFGNTVVKYDGIELIDLEQYYDGTNTKDVIPVRTTAEYRQVTVTSTTFAALKSKLYTESSGTYTAVPASGTGSTYDSTATYYIQIGAANSTDLYAVRIGLDAFCGVTPEGGSIGLESHLPDFTEAKTVHTGDVELIGGVALKNTKTAAVLRGIVIA